MAKKSKTPQELDDLISQFLDDFQKKDPAMFELVLDGIEKRSKGEGCYILDELRDFESNRHEVPEQEVTDFNIPRYLDFWGYYGGHSSRDDYDELMDECSKKTKSQLTKDINTFLNSVPTYYREQDTLTPTNVWMIAAVIIKYNLKKCHVPMLNLLRCEDYVIQDLFMDDETSSYDVYAEMCHDQLQELHAIAVDDNVMPYARGIAIGAIAKSIEHSPKDGLLIFNLLKNVIETYRERAKADRKVSVAIIRATSLAAARMHLHSMLPYIEEVYRKLRISAKGIGAISRVRELMDDDNEHLGTSEPTIDMLEDFLDFEERIFGDTFDKLRHEEYDDEYDDDDDDEYDDDDYDDFEYDDDDDDDLEDDDDDDDWEMPELKLEDFRKTKLVNGKVRILGEDFVKAHPKGLSTFTDKSYIDFANSVCKRITGMASDLRNDDIKSIAMKCTLYYEDMIADAGIWRSFIERMRKMYGKPLPFHSVDEVSYYPDEPNLPDVKLLVWLACLDSHTAGVYNPENDVLMKIAEAIYRLMDDRFEDMPVNEALHDYFHDATFMNDFYHARDAVKWVYLSSYLTATTKALTALIDRANACQEIYGMHAFYQCESTVIYDTFIGPLGLTAPEWLAMILRSNGRSKDADGIAAMSGMVRFYHVENRRGDSFTVKGSDGKVLTFDRSGFGDIVEDQLTNDYFFGCLVPYNGDVYLSGTCLWNNDYMDAYNEEEKRYEVMKKTCVPGYDRIMGNNNGSPLFYFKDTASARQFLHDAGIRNMESVSMLTHNDKDCVLYFPSRNEPFIFLPGIASVINDPCNRYYNESTAMTNYLDLPLSLPYKLAVYLFKHGYLPYAGFRNQHGDEVGRRQLHDNYDFILRCLAPENIKIPVANRMSHFSML